MLNRYLKPELLIIDDMGMKALPQNGAELFLEIIVRRNGLRSTLMTSNRPIDEWGQLLGDLPAPEPSSTGCYTKPRSSP